MQSSRYSGSKDKPLAGKKGKAQVATLNKSLRHAGPKEALASQERMFAPRRGSRFEGHSQAPCLCQGNLHTVASMANAGSRAMRRIVREPLIQGPAASEHVQWLEVMVIVVYE